VSRSLDGLSCEVPASRFWSGALAAIPLALAVLIHSPVVSRPDLVVVVGLALFGLHSYLILAYAGSEKAAEDVGFYYAANATGRLMGILLSGLLYQTGGLTTCLVGSGAMLTICRLISFLLPASLQAVSADRQIA
jgi:hypothetical protein